MNFTPLKIALLVLLVTVLLCYAIVTLASSSAPISDSAVTIQDFFVAERNHDGGVNDFSDNKSTMKRAQIQSIGCYNQ